MTESSKIPTLSVIIPVYNEEKYIEKTIKESFNHFDEVIIVNDSSKDETLNKINKLELQDFNNLKWHTWHVDSVNDIEKLIKRKSTGIILLKNNKHLDNLN